MRICHFSDSHLGAGEGHPKRGSSGLTLRQEDMISSFVEAVDRIISLKPDLCVHSGDLFHSVRPTNRIMALAGQQFYRLAQEHGIPTVLICGNHDAPKLALTGAAIDVFAQIPNLCVVSGGMPQSFLLGSVRVFAVPHIHQAAAFRDAIKQCIPDPKSNFNILVTHGVASGLPQFSMADLGEQEIPVELLERFDYVAMGHYHNCCEVTPRVYYAGSTERLSQSERESPKGLLEVDLDPLSVAFHEVTTRPMLDLPPIDASGKRGDELATLLQTTLAQSGADRKIVRLRVTGVTTETLKTLPPNVLSELKQQAFSLDLRFDREAPESETRSFGRTAIGSLDEEFLRHLERAELSDLDRERLEEEGLHYLREQSEL